MNTGTKCAKKCSEVYLYSVLLLKQISIRKIIEYRQTDFTRIIDRLQLTLIRA